MKKYMFLAICGLLMSAACCAQRKQIGDARTILKSGKNIEQAEKLMTDLLKDKANEENTRIYDIWLQAAGCREAVSGSEREDVCQGEGRYNQVLRFGQTHVCSC